MTSAGRRAGKQRIKAQSEFHSLDTFGLSFECRSYPIITGSQWTTVHSHNVSMTFYKHLKSQHVCSTLSFVSNNMHTALSEL